MIDLGVQCQKVGMMFSAGAQAVTEIHCVRAVDAACDYLVGEMKAQANVASGATRDGIKVVGRGMAKRVRTGTWQSIPIDQGYTAGTTPPRALEQWAEKKGFSGKQARAIAFAIAKSRKGRKVKGQEFFYKVWDRTQPIIWGRFLGPLGIEIAKALA